MLTQKRLREVLRYDPATGVFNWVKGERRGRVAGTPHDVRGALKVSIDNQRHLLHRLAWLWMTGALPRSNIAHVDGDYSNNRWSNLRIGVRDQKPAYRPPVFEPTKTPGVWRKGDQFDALVDVEGGRLNLGSFATSEQASDALQTALANARRRQAQGRRTLK